MINEAKKIELARWLLDPDSSFLQEGSEDPAEVLAGLEQRLERAGLNKIFREIELPLVEVLEEMHRVGIKIDPGYLKGLSKDLDGELVKLVKDIYKKAGGEFNLNSPKQLSGILFEKLQINPEGIPKKKTGAYSTDAETLNFIKDRHPIVAPMLKYRELFKLQSTYVLPLQELIAKDGRIHTSFIQTGAATGRLSSQNPNLQNIPVSTEWGKKIRGAFIAEKGNSLVSLDYSQIELRVLASVAGDPEMIAAFKKGLDIHKVTASKVFNVPIEKVTSEMRSLAKTLNFGVIYGMGPNAFAQTGNISVAEAKKFIQEYFADFSSVKGWQEDMINRAKKDKYVTNLNGRRRLVPGITHPNRRFSSEAERVVTNMPIQGLAADIIKLAMIRGEELIQKKKWQGKARLLLSIHDELIFEVDDKMVEEVVPEIKKIMEGAYKLKDVELRVDSAIGKNWSEL
ncbi:MAG: DNA polymerase I [Parcubacteria group bacterium Gr01-1014_19]|nr:MAG: DNA polymerase I [Parcubacteria group bacterium Gr01-1014_19]